MLMIWASILILLVIVLATTVPMWVPALLRFLRQDLARIELAEMARWEREMQRQRLDYETAVQRAAQRRGLPDSEWPELSMRLERWWHRYAAAEISWQTALCEAESWISRRVRLATDVPHAERQSAAGPHVPHAERQSAAGPHVPHAERQSAAGVTS
jgi:hypothetical protein